MGNKMVDSWSVLSDRLIKAKENIADAFVQCFEKQSFAFHEPDSLLPTRDHSTLFIGSTISTFKYLLSDRHKTRKPLRYYTRQTCLRTQNNRRFGTEYHPCWSSLFSSVGALSGWEDRETIIRATMDFAKALARIGNIDVRIHISSTDIDLVTLLRGYASRIPLIFDSKPLPYYRHKFGIEGVGGRNCNFAVSLDGQHYSDIGNLIVIEDLNVPLAVESAFGLETIASRMYGLDSSVYALDAARDIEELCSESLLLVDALVASVAIISVGIRPIADNRGRVLRRYLQGISPLRKELGMSIEDVAAIAGRFEANFNHSNHIHTFIQRYLSAYEDLLEQGRAPDAVNASLSRRFADTASERI
ncbi:hypothetical protein [Pectobacterium colocasium]|uniref:hypothetical protein n=1 Tax=Pectobacterium colocasium TaxID=2878098 RepID=UPI001CD265F6|nr:hypothetical protein [Pectobacterium colocasium]